MESEAKPSKLTLVSIYLAVWVAVIAVFWLAPSKGSEIDAMGYSLAVFWFVLPVVTFVDSLLISMNHYWENYKWLASIGFGIMYMLAEYMTFSMANNIAFDKVNVPQFSMILIGAVISLAGMGIGHLILNIKKRLPRNRSRDRADSTEVKIG